ncbi:MAG TPA: phosphoribosylanthranilate isomerase, partial [Planctomicrobium sp.]|nr:phosphoribosylanthranilate isomerase [Planctomicrobium sp.]
ESPEFIAELAEFNIIRAFRVGNEGLDDVARQLERFQQLGITMTRCIVDALVSGAYGGTGHHAPWDLLRRDWQPDWPALILAGGLTSANVAQAIEAAQPQGVDVASGVEISPGHHDPEEIARFIQRARAAQS